MSALLQIEDLLRTPQNLTPELVQLLLLLSGGYTVISITKRAVNWYLSKKEQESGLTVTKAQNEIEEEKARSQREYELELMDRKERQDLIQATFQMSRGMMATSDFMIKKAERDEEISAALLRNHERMLEQIAGTEKTNQMTNEILIQLLEGFKQAQAEGKTLYRDDLSRIVATIEGLTLAFTTTIVDIKEDVARIRMHVGMEKTKPDGPDGESPNT